jgi:dynein heavy chain
MTINIM